MASAKRSARKLFPRACLDLSLQWRHAASATTVLASFSRIYFCFGHWHCLSCCRHDEHPLAMCLQNKPNKPSAMGAYTRVGGQQVIMWERADFSSPWRFCRNSRFIDTAGSLAQWSYACQTKTQCQHKHTYPVHPSASFREPKPFREAAPVAQCACSTTDFRAST